LVPSLIARSLSSIAAVSWCRQWWNICEFTSRRATGLGDSATFARYLSAMDTPVEVAAPRKAALAFIFAIVLLDVIALTWWVTRGPARRA
jgi:hypothetical protein